MVGGTSCVRIEQLPTRLVYEFSYGLEGWNIATTTPYDPIFPVWQESYGGRIGVVNLTSCTYPAHDQRAGGPTYSILRKRMLLPRTAKRLNIVAAKKVGGWPESGYSDGFLAVKINDQELARWYLRAWKDAKPRWLTYSVNISSWAGQTVLVEIIGVPGGDGRACFTCTGTCDNEDVMVDSIRIIVPDGKKG